MWTVLGRSNQGRKDGRCMYWGLKNAYNILVGNPEGKRLLERLGLRYENNIVSLLSFLAYFSEMKVGLSHCQSVCVYPQ
jgi:hypothetical protein